MFFFFSKTLNFLTMPLVIICVLLFLSLIFKNPKRRRRLLIAGVALLIFFSNDFIANEFMKAWEIPATPLAEIKKQYAWAILLSGVTKSDMEPKDRVYVQHGADRVLHTYRLYREGIVQKILVSGGSGRLVDVGQREADEIASLLVLMGVKPQDILTDNIARNTRESAVEVKKLLGGKAAPSDCLLITSAFHMRRSAACFSKVGWKMDVFSTDFLSHKRNFSPDVLFIPQLEGLSDWNVLVKEWVGCVAYAVAGYI